RVGTILVEHDCLPLRFTLSRARVAAAVVVPRILSSSPSRPQGKSLNSSETAPTMSPPTKAAAAQRYRTRLRLRFGTRIPTKVSCSDGGGDRNRSSYSRMVIRLLDDRVRPSLSGISGALAGKGLETMPP